MSAELNRAIERAERSSSNIWTPIPSMATAPTVSQDWANGQAPLASAELRASGLLAAIQLTC